MNQAGLRRMFVTLCCVMVVAGEGAGQKLAAAQAAGIPIMDEAAFIEFLEAKE